MRIQIMRVITEERNGSNVKRESFETIDRDCIKYYKAHGATIIKTGSYVKCNTAR